MTTDKRLDPFDTGFEHGKGIKTNPVTEKLTMEIAMKYPKAKILDYTSSKDNPTEYRSIFRYIYSQGEFDGANIEFTLQEDFETHYISQCKLQLRPLSSLTDEEKEYIIAQWLNETLDKWTNLDEVFALIFDTCSFEDIIRFIDYVRSLNVDVEVPSLQERGIAEYE